MSPVHQLIIFFELTKFEAASCNSFGESLLQVFIAQICKGQ